MLSLIENSTWLGNVRFMGQQNEIWLTFDSEKAYISFPQRGQYNIPSVIIANSTYISIPLRSVGLNGKIVFMLEDSCASSAVLFSETKPPEVFSLQRQQTNRWLQKGTIYQPPVNVDHYANILCKYADIDFSILDQIEYEPQTNSIYKILYREYRLENYSNLTDSCAALRLTQWVNKYVKQAGMVILPTNCDALSLLENVQKLGMPLNCKGCSIILTDLLNAMGIKARMANCMSKDVFDPESHYMTECFCRDLNKWIAVDAAFGCCYVTNDTLLNIAEIRSLLCSGKKISYMKNTKNAQTAYCYEIQQMLYKNMYRFSYYDTYKPGYANGITAVQRINIAPEEITTNF